MQDLFQDLLLGSFANLLVSSMDCKNQKSGHPEPCDTVAVSVPSWFCLDLREATNPSDNCVTSSLNSLKGVIQEILFGQLRGIL